MTLRSRTASKRKRRTRRKRRSVLRPSNLLRLGVIGTVLYFVFSLGAGIFLAEHAIRPEREPINPINSEPLWNFARRIRATMSDAEIERPGNVTLRGWGIRPANANSGSVLLLHGLSENRTAMSGVAEFLLAAGYSVLMPDARAHGESGGDVATYGLLEAVGHPRLGRLDSEQSAPRMRLRAGRVHGRCTIARKSRRGDPLLCGGR